MSQDNEIKVHSSMPNRPIPSRRRDIEIRIKRDSKYICSHHADYLAEYRYKNSVSADVAIPPCGGRVAVFSEIPPVQLIPKCTMNISTMLTKCNHDEPASSDDKDGNVVTIGYNNNYVSICSFCGKRLSAKEAAMKKARIDCLLAAKKRCQVDEKRNVLSKGVSIRDFNITKRQDERMENRIINSKKNSELFDLNKINIINPKYKTTTNCMDNILLKEDIDQINKTKHSAEWKTEKDLQQNWKSIEQDDSAVLNEYLNNKSLLKKDSLLDIDERKTKIEMEDNILTELANLRLSEIIEIMADKHVHDDTKADIETMFEKMNPDKQIVKHIQTIYKPTIQDADPELAIENLKQLHRKAFQEGKTKKNWRALIMGNMMKSIRQEIFSRRLLNSTKDARHRKWVKLQKYNKQRKAENDEMSITSKQALKSGLKNKNAQTANTNIQWVTGDVSKRQEYDRSDEEESDAEIRVRRKSKLLNRKTTGFIGSSPVYRDLNSINNSNNINTRTGVSSSDLLSDFDELNNFQKGNTCGNISSDDQDCCSKVQKYDSNNNNCNNNIFNKNKSNRFDFISLMDDTGTHTSDRRLYQLDNNCKYNVNNNAYYKQDYLHKPMMVDKSTFVRPRNTSCKCCEFGCPAETSQEYEQQQTAQDSRRRSSVREETIHRMGSPSLLMAMPPTGNHRSEIRRKSNILQPGYHESMHQQQQQQQHMPYTQSITSGILRPDRRGQSLINSYVRDVNENTKIELGTLLKGVGIIFALWMISNIYTYGIVGYIKHLMGFEMDDPQDEVFMRYFENKR